MGFIATALWFYFGLLTDLTTKVAVQEQCIVSQSKTIDDIQDKVEKIYDLMLEKGK